jgi:hypothetical protein
MKSKLAKRLENLELAAGMSSEPAGIIQLLYCQDPDALLDPSFRAERARAGGKWYYPEPGETHSDFVDRIAAELRSKRKYGPSHMITLIAPEKKPDKALRDDVGTGSATEPDASPES